MRAMTRLFTPPTIVDSTHPDHEEIRETALNAARTATAVAVKGSMVLALTPTGTLRGVRTKDTVCFDGLPANMTTRYTFWMNASSVENVGRDLRNVPRVSMEAAMLA